MVSSCSYQKLFYVLSEIDSSKFELLSFVELEFCHNMNFWFLSQFEILNLVAIRVFEFSCYISLYTIPVLHFVTIGVFAFCHKSCLSKSPASILLLRCPPLWMMCQESQYSAQPQGVDSFLPLLHFKQPFFYSWDFFSQIQPEPWTNFWTEWDSWRRPWKKRWR